MSDDDTSDHPRDVVVGYDGSPAAAAAVTWAAREAGLRGARLRLVTGVHYPTFPLAPTLSPDREGTAPVVEHLEALAETVCAQGRQLAAATLREEDIVVEQTAEGAATALVAASRDAALVVVGSRGRGGAISALLGSVSLAVTAHAHSTVVVVPSDEVPHDEGPVVVGVDAGAESRTALRVAGDLAARHRRPLVVLTAWQLTLTPSMPTGGWERWAPAWLDEVRKAAEDTADRASGIARERHPGLTVTSQVVESLPAPALSTASRTAHTVVVGTRGLGGLDRLLLGSVSRSVLHHATCPVVVAR